MRRWQRLGVAGSLIAVSVTVMLSTSVAQVSAAPGSYVPLASPQRLLDSRPGAATADGQFSGIGLRPAGSTLTLHVAGRVGVPGDADAVVLNVTAVDPTNVGHRSQDVELDDAGQVLFIIHRTITVFP